MQPLAFRADFECANALSIEQTGDCTATILSRPDRATNTEIYAESDYYCAFRVYNPNDVPVEASPVVKVRSLPPAGRSVAVRRRGTSGEPHVLDWQPIPAASTHTDADAGVTSFRTTVLPRESLDVSTMYWQSASEVYASLQSLPVSWIGETAGGRRIPAVDLANVTGAPPDAPLLCIAATPQSHELGTIACMFLVNELVRGSLSVIAARARLVVLPLSNPDGNAHGTCMTNAVHENVHFGYGDDDTMPAECRAVWSFVSQLSPAAYLELHSYPHLNRPSFRPYAWDLSLFPGERSRHAGERFFRAVSSVSPNEPYRIRAGTDQELRFRATLPSRLIRELGIPATIYKLHNRETVERNCAHAANLLGGLVDELASE
jgi:hypothetical protein